MKIYKQFLSKDLYEAVWEYAQKKTYRKVQDGIYNFRGINIEGDLRSRLENVFLDYGFKGRVDVLRLQRIDEGFKVAENFHTHNLNSIENIVCFLNDNFTGGEFEYMDYNIKMITPTKNTAISFTPDTPHRVNTVTKGTRHTLVAFLEESSYIKKQETLI